VLYLYVSFCFVCSVSICLHPPKISSRVRVIMFFIPLNSARACDANKRFIINAFNCRCIICVVVVFFVCVLFVPELGCAYKGSYLYFNNTTGVAFGFRHSVATVASSFLGA